VKRCRGPDAEPPPESNQAPSRTEEEDLGGPVGGYGGHPQNRTAAGERKETLDRHDRGHLLSMQVVMYSNIMSHPSLEWE
jgi:hypothetical protein